MFKPFLYAIGFLTRLPVPHTLDMPSDREQGQSVLYYPLVGLLIGLILFALANLMSDAEPLLSAAVLITVWVVVTGGLHIDGLADVADAWIGGQGDRERTLALMKDPTCGPIAVATVVLLLMVKVAALTSLLLDQHGTVVLVVPILGRAALVAGFIYIPYVRSGGLGAVLTENMPQSEAKKTLVIATLFPFLFWGWDAVWVFAGCYLLFVFVRRSVLNRIHGLTGDVAGALCELIEVTALLIAAFVF
ncbi:adenosylcobinamide-GDP ribazoletransferase [Sedimenticola selenatireducens]|uniref:Adenosylcobinamide-GDP ribazoletransferase n=1 Tax=Sedimenticola selenatireducens TaxID=191960 RepID=A0A557SNK4_9GAMM|nr:adenosylcobinamide-GDP ribazoletransferase [Sedimenticola selenatireducens]TVO78998.1 adenosylcobinamide-GDP ribazoletransferase [Sedimenticola selenatireducens]TVT67210.1 MAG: adenosylcobinamide-GDP ribazoletransferase [Sedimenticola selenatireducens]